MALIRQVSQNPYTKKWAYIEYSDEQTNPIVDILGGEEFDTKDEAVEWSEGFTIDSYKRQPLQEIKANKIHVIQLTPKQVAKGLFEIHNHIDGSEGTGFIYYTETDLLKLFEQWGIPQPDWEANANDHV